MIKKFFFAFCLRFYVNRVDAMTSVYNVFQKDGLHYISDIAIYKCFTGLTMFSKMDG